MCSFAPLCRPWTSSLAIEKKKRKFDLMQKLFSSSNGCVFGRRTWSKPRCDGGSSASCWERRKWGSKKKQEEEMERNSAEIFPSYKLLSVSHLIPLLSTQFHHKFHLSSHPRSHPLSAFPHPHDLTLVLLTVPVVGDSSTFCVCVISPPAILRLRVSNRRRFSRGF